MSDQKHSITPAETFARCCDARLAATYPITIVAPTRPEFMVGDLKIGPNHFGELDISGHCTKDHEGLHRFIAETWGIPNTLKARVAELENESAILRQALREAKANLSLIRENPTRRGIAQVEIFITETLANF